MISFLVSGIHYRKLSIFVECVGGWEHARLTKVCHFSETFLAVVREKKPHLPLMPHLHSVSHLGKEESTRLQVDCHQSRMTAS